MPNSVRSVRHACPLFSFMMSVFFFFFFLVATASYRLLPHIKITKPIPPQLAEKFQQCFSPGVINVDPNTKSVTVDESGSRKDSVSREVLRHPEFADSVELSRVRDYFLCECFIDVGIRSNVHRVNS